MPNSSLPAVPAGLGNGIIEIAGLTALIGSSTATSLILGDRGAAGLPWAVMSIFGALHVVRACVGAITPGWLRDTLGVRSQETDLAVGWSLDLARGHLRSRSRIGGAIGVACDAPPVDTGGHRGLLRIKFKPKAHRRDIYAFDRLTSEYLGFVLPTDPSDQLKVYLLSEDAYNQTKLRKSCLARCHGTCWLHDKTYGGVCWVFFFLGAVILQAFSISREFYEEQRSHVDLLTGQLPTPIKPGGHRKVFLAAPANNRHKLTWTIVWAVGGLTGVVSVIGCYILLGNQSKDTFYIYMAFQILWLALRSVFFHFAEGSDKIFNHPSLSVRSYESLSPELKTRVKDLVFALSLYQRRVHPRGEYFYVDDLQNIDVLETILPEIPLQDVQPVPRKSGKFNIKIDGVVGDTMLSSAAWTFGSKLTSMDVYDSCIVIFSIGGRKVAVPSARVITDVRPDTPKDEELSQEKKFPPRGGSNSGGPSVHWNYWIPCSGGDGDWLHIRTQGLYVRGDQEAILVTDAQVTEKLSSGEFFNSLTHVGEVREIVRNSSLGCQVLERMLR